MSKFFSFFLSPLRCELCHQFVKKIPSLCLDCVSKLTVLPEAHCRICALPFESAQSSSHACSACLQNPPGFSEVMAPFEWCDAIAHSIHQIKFSHRLSLIEALADQACPVFAEWVKAYAPEQIVPVPLNWRRRLKRGYNQSTVLADKLCQLSGLNIPVVQKIHRTYRDPQAKKNRQERFRALKGAFKLKTPQVFKNKKILLVDDVMTTGATLQALSQKLLECGAQEIRVFVLARVRAKK